MELALETRSPIGSARRRAGAGAATATARGPRRRSSRWTGRSAASSRASSKTEKFEGKPGQISYFHTGGAIPAERVLVVGLGRSARGAGPRRRDHAPRRRRRGAARARPGRRFRRRVHARRRAARARARPGGRGGRPARHLSLRQVPEGEERQGGPRRSTVLEPDRRQRGRRARRACASAASRAEATCLARDLVNEPANVVTPTFLAAPRGRDRQGGRAQRARARRGPSAPSWAWAPIVGVAQGSEEPPQVHPPHLHAEGPGAAPRGGHRQGHHVRLGRTRSQDRRRHAADEGRHVGRRRRARHLPGAAAAQAARRGARAHRRHREHALGHRAAARATSCGR